MSDDDEFKNEPLDALLQNWAVARGLPRERADVIRQAVLSPANELSPEWSGNFATWLMGVLSQARAASVASFQAASGGDWLNRADAQAPGFQPYVRLAMGA